MTLDDFLNTVKLELMDSSVELIDVNYEFRKLDEWSSLFIMILAIKLQDDFSIKFNADHMKNSTTFGELYSEIIGNQ
jgi:acyl carrier protein